MELTITQNGALYLCAHRIRKNRRAFFRLSRAAANRQGPDVRKHSEPILSNLVGPRYHPDNGR